MEQRSVILISYDGLGCGYLGPYGNTWVPTPAWNELAARGVVLDSAFANGPMRGDALRSLWSGRHPIQPSNAPVWLASECDAADICSVLVSDEPAVLEHPGARSFSRQVLLEDAPKVAAVSLEETNVVRSAIAACEAVLEAEPPFFVLVQLSALASAWDVPFDMRQQLADEEDPLVPDFIEPPEGDFADADPDEVWAIQLSYAAQMMAVDASLGVMVDLVTGLRSANDVMLCATSPRGYALGVGGQVGLGTGSLSSEELHLPLVMDVGDHELAGQHLNALCEPSLIHAAVQSWLGLPSAPSIPFEFNLHGMGSSRVVAISPSHEALRTPAWFYRQSRTTSSSVSEPREMELFVKPDDRWDVNEISARCPEIAEQMRQTLEEYIQAAEQDQLHRLSELPDSLAAED